MSYRRFETGAQRDANHTKGRYDLISPMALARLARRYQEGADRYGARNWELGQPHSVLVDSAMRHMSKYLMGLRDEDHLAAVAWNVFALMHQEHQIESGLLPEGLDDLPDYAGEKL